MLEPRHHDAKLGIPACTVRRGTFSASAELLFRLLARHQLYRRFMNRRNEKLAAEEEIAMTSFRTISRSILSRNGHLGGHASPALLDPRSSGERHRCPSQPLRYCSTSSSRRFDYPSSKGKSAARRDEVSRRACWHARRSRLAREGGRSPRRRVALSTRGGRAPGRRLCLAATGKLLVASGRGNRRRYRDRGRQRGDRRGLGGRATRARLLLVLYLSGAPAGFLGRLPVECKTK